MNDASLLKEMMLAKALKTYLLPAILLALFALVIYSKTFQAPFFLDDYAAIKDNMDIRMENISLDALEKALQGAPFNRPLAKLSFALNYYFGQYDVSGYHFVNLIIHALSGIFLFFLFRVTLSSEKDIKLKPHPLQQNITLLAFLAALLWIVHPVNTQSVTYIVQRMNSMAAMFYILSVFLYAKCRINYRSGRHRWAAYLTACVLAGFLGLASKQTAATLPVVIFVYEWFFFQDLSFRWLVRKIPWIIGIIILLGGLGALYLGGNPLDKIHALYIRTSSLQHFSIAERLNTECRVLVYYITLFLFPHPARLHIDYIYPLSQTIAVPFTTILTVIAHVCLLGFVVLGARKYRVLSFCIIWFYITLAIESSFVGLALIFEHRTYLPFMMLGMASVALISELIPARKPLIFVVCILTLLFSVGTFQRNLAWQERMLFWQDNLLKSPENARTHTMIGRIHFNNNQLDEAITCFKKALSLKGDNQHAHIMLADTYMATGKAEKAAYHYEKARLIEFWDPEILIKLGNAYFQANNWQKALKNYQSAVDMNPRSAEALYGKAFSLSKLGRQEAAIDAYQKLVHLAPEHVYAHKNLADLYFQKQELERAISHYKTTMALAPDYVQAHYNLAICYANKSNFDAATRHLKKALAINPDYKQAEIALRQIKADKDKQ